MKQEPNLIIFRIPDENDAQYPTKIRLVELTYLDGVLQPTGQVFMPTENSTYNKLTMGHVVLARTTAEGSLELSRFEVSEKGSSPTVIHELQFEEIKDIVQTLLKAYNQPDLDNCEEK